MLIEYLMVGRLPEGASMSELAKEIAAYESKLDVVLKACSARSKQSDRARRAQLLDSDVLDVLATRENIAQLLSKEPKLISEQVSQLANLDQLLTDNCQPITRCVSGQAFSKWRGALQIREPLWWWRLDECAAKSRWNLHYFGALVMWIVIAISLSYIIEMVRRFLTGGVDILSTVIQGLLALIVGGTIAQIAWHFVEVVKQRTAERWVRRRQWTRVAFTVLLLAVASLIQLNLRRIASFYSNKCANYLLDGDVSAGTKNCLRAANLEPADARAHWVLGKAYEAIYQHDKARDEFQSTIRYDSGHCRAYLDLSHDYIVQRKDYAGALQLLNLAVEKCDTAIPSNAHFTAEQKPFVLYALYKNLGWAYASLDQPWLAEQNLLNALKLKEDGAEANCLMGQVMEKTGRKAEASEYWSKCVDFARTPKDQIDFKGKDDVEPSLLGIARERAKQSGISEGGSDE